MFQTSIFSEEKYTDFLMKNVMVVSRRDLFLLDSVSLLRRTEICISLRDDTFEGFLSGCFLVFILWVFFFVVFF